MLERKRVNGVRAPKHDLGLASYLGRHQKLTVWLKQRSRGKNDLHQSFEACVAAVLLQALRLCDPFEKLSFQEDELFPDRQRSLVLKDGPFARLDFGEHLNQIR